MQLFIIMYNPTSNFIMLVIEFPIHQRSLNHTLNRKQLWGHANWATADVILYLQTKKVLTWSYSHNMPREPSPPPEMGQQQHPRIFSSPATLQHKFKRTCSSLQGSWLWILMQFPELPQKMHQYTFRGLECTESLKIISQNLKLLCCKISHNFHELSA